MPPRRAQPSDPSRGSFNMRPMEEPLGQNVEGADEASSPSYIPRGPPSRQGYPYYGPSQNGPHSRNGNGPSQYYGGSPPYHPESQGSYGGQYQYPPPAFENQGPGHGMYEGAHGYGYQPPPPNRQYGYHGEQGGYSNQSKQPSKPTSIFDELLKKTITIILVGETGVGKTAFMNFLGNICQLRDPSSYRPAHDIRNEAGEDKSKSQTKEARMYEFQGPNHGLTIKILDTPGFADTGGIHLDNDHRKGITKVIGEQVERLDAVLVIANGTVERLSLGTQLALATISTMFPSSIISNTGFLYTNVTGPLDCNTQVTSIPQKLRKCQSWEIQNPMAQHAKYLEVKAKTMDPVNLEKLQSGIDKCHYAALETLKKLLTWMDKCDPISTTEIVKLAEKREELEMNMENIIQTIRTLGEKQVQIANLKDQASNAENKVQFTKDFETITNTTQWQRVPYTGHHTVCDYTDCHSNCHIKCFLPKLSDHVTIGRKCIAFGQGTSTTCNCGHTANYHAHLRYIWKHDLIQNVTVNEDRKKQHDQATYDLRTTEGKHKALETERAKSQYALDNALDRLGQLCQEFNAIAMSGSFSGFISSRIAALEEQQEVMKMNGSIPEAMTGMEKSISLLKNQLGAIQMAEKAKNRST